MDSSDSFLKIQKKAIEVFGSEDKAKTWLEKPLRIFNGVSPQEYMTSDETAKQVFEELIKIDEGYFG